MVYDAEVVELVDTLCSGRSGLLPVRVRISPSACSMADPHEFMRVFCWERRCSGPARPPVAYPVGVVIRVDLDHVDRLDGFTGSPLPRVDLIEGMGRKDIHVARPVQVDRTDLQVNARLKSVVQILRVFNLKIYFETEPVVFIRNNRERKGDGDIPQVGGIDRGQLVFVRSYPACWSWF